MLLKVLKGFLLCWPGGDLYEELKRVGGRFRERDTAARVLGPCLQVRVLRAFLQTAI